MILSSCLKQIFSTILRKVPFMPSSLLRIKFILPSSGELVVFKCLGVSQVFLHTTFHCSIGYFCIMSDIAELFFKKKYFFSDCAHWITWKTTDPVWKKIIFTEASTPPALNIVIITISLLRIDVLCSCKHFTRADFLSSVFFVQCEMKHCLS